MKERNREERGTGLKVKKQIKRNKNIPPLPLPATRIAGFAQLKPVSVVSHCNTLKVLITTAADNCFSEKIMACHFIRTVCLLDNPHEMPSLIFSEKIW